MTRQELAQTIKTKYPVYQNLDDNVLVDKILAKYPVYQKQITEPQPAEQPMTVGKPQNRDILDTLAGKSPDQLAEEGHPILAGIQATGKEMIAPLAHFGNQLLMNYPQSALKKAGYDYPQPTTLASKIPTYTAGFIGGLKNPASKLVGGGIIKGVGLGKKMLQGAAAGAMYAPTEDILGVKERALAAGIGGAIPAVGSLVGKGIKAVMNAPQIQANWAARQINSLIAKGNKKEYKFGKNPGAGVAKYRITANRIEDLPAAIEPKIAEVEAKTNEVLNHPQFANKQVNLEKALEPIDEQILKLAEDPRGNGAVIKRLTDAKLDLLGVKVGDEGIIDQLPELRRLSPLEATQLKRRAGRKTKWGNEVGDNLFIPTMRSVYHNIKESIEGQVPPIKELNEDWANLIGAKNAAENRATVAKGLNIMSPGALGAGIGSAVIEAIHSGGNKISSILAGTSAAMLIKAMGSTPVKTRIAKVLMNMSDGEKATLYAKMPQVEEAISKVFDKSKEFLARVQGRQQQQTAENIASKFRKPPPNIPPSGGTPPPSLPPEVPPTRPMPPPVRPVTPPEISNIPQIKINVSKAKSNFDNFMNDVAYKQNSESHGQFILDELERGNSSVDSVTNRFWDSSYKNAPEKVKAYIHNHLKKSGFSPGTIVGTDKNGQNIIPKSWEEAGKMFAKDLPQNIEDLQGTERGLVAIMAENNNRLPSKPPASPARVDEVIKGQNKTSFEPDVTLTGGNAKIAREQQVEARKNIELSKQYNFTFKEGDTVTDKTTGKKYIIKSSYFENGEPRYNIYTPGKKQSPAHQFWAKEKDFKQSTPTIGSFLKNEKGNIDLVSALKEARKKNK